MDPWSEGRSIRSQLGLLLEDIELPIRFTGRRFIKFLSNMHWIGRYRHTRRVC